MNLLLLLTLTAQPADWLLDRLTLTNGAVFPGLLLPEDEQIWTVTRTLGDQVLVMIANCSSEPASVPADAIPAPAGSDPAPAAAGPPSSPPARTTTACCARSSRGWSTEVTAPDQAGPSR